ncbi:MAG: DUF1015 domain-containing protein [Candidatus Thorarchaeota archaeon]
MVSISSLKPYIPKNPEEFCTNPYDIIGKEEELELKKNPNSLIYLILPDGIGDEIYQNAKKALERFKRDNLIIREKRPSIFVYRQESESFSHQGLILAISLKDYEAGNIVIHEHTREKPLEDRTKHIITTKVSAGLVWTVFKANRKINSIIEKIKQKEPILNFRKYNYQHLLWQETNYDIIESLRKLFKKEKLYIADGHHRAASAAAYRKNTKISHTQVSENAPWQYFLSYVASDDQVRILPYNRVIKKLPLNEHDFLARIKNDFEVITIEKPLNPSKKNEITICLLGKWYKLVVKQIKFKSVRDSLDVAILQDKILSPILDISDPRSDENIFFVGGYLSPESMEKYVTEKGNDLFINLYPVSIRDLEKVGTEGNLMPPKSTWFDPKLLSGLVIHTLEE